MMHDVTKSASGWVSKKQGGGVVEGGKGRGKARGGGSFTSNDGVGPW